MKGGKVKCGKLKGSKVKGGKVKGGKGKGKDGKGGKDKKSHLSFGNGQKASPPQHRPVAAQQQAVQQWQLS